MLKSLSLNLRLKPSIVEKRFWCSSTPPKQTIVSYLINPRVELTRGYLRLCNILIWFSWKVLLLRSICIGWMKSEVWLMLLPPNRSRLSLFWRGANNDDGLVSHTKGKSKPSQGMTYQVRLQKSNFSSKLQQTLRFLLCPPNTQTFSLYTKAVARVLQTLRSLRLSHLFCYNRKTSVDFRIFFWSSRPPTAKTIFLASWQTKVWPDLAVFIGGTQIIEYSFRSEFRLTTKAWLVDFILDIELPTAPPQTRNSRLETAAAAQKRGNLSWNLIQKVDLWFSFWILHSQRSILPLYQMSFSTKSSRWLDSPVF